MTGLDKALRSVYNNSRMFVRSKKQGNKTYYYLVESKREGKRVIQKAIKYLGAEKPTPGELEDIIDIIDIINGIKGKDPEIAAKTAPKVKTGGNE